MQNGHMLFPFLVAFTFTWCHSGVECSISVRCFLRFASDSKHWKHVR